MAKNTSDGGGKTPKPSKGRKIHGGEKPSLSIFSWFTRKSDPKGSSSGR